MLNLEVEEHLQVVRETFDDCFLGKIQDTGRLIDTAFKNNGKVILFGNGGSAADAQHISAEFISKLKKDRVSLPSIALTVDTSALTAIANDYGYDDVFSRQISSLCLPNDVVIGISTSGRSVNVINGLLAAKAIGAKTVGFAGQTGIKGIELDVCFNVKSQTTARIQELHIMIGHLICSEAEQRYV